MSTPGHKTTIIRCPDCKASFSISDGIASCNCGTRPVNIIVLQLSHRHPEIAHKLQRYEINADWIRYQQRFHEFMKVSSEPDVSNYFLDKLQAVPEHLRPLTFGFNTIQAVNNILSRGNIESREATNNYYIIPETIDNLITGFILIHPIFENISRIVWKEGGLCLGYTANQANYSYNNIFIFQDPLIALRFFFNFLIFENSMPAVMAAPFMDIEHAYKWLPNRELVLILRQYVPDKYRHLKPFKPRIVPESAVNLLSFSKTELLLYLAKSKPLDHELTSSVPLTARTSIIARQNAWYALPSSDQALNVNIQIHRVYKYKQAYRYIGRILSDSIQIPFRITGKHRFYKKIEKLCADAGLSLYCMPSLKANLADVAVALSYPVKTYRYRPRITKEKVVLPNVIVTGRKIKNINMGFKDEPAGRIRLYTKNVSLEPDTQSQLEHLLFLFAFCCALGRKIYLGKATDIAILGEYNRITEAMLKQLSIPVASEAPTKAFWPVAYKTFSLDILRNKQNKLYFVNELQALVAMYLSTGLIFGLTSSSSQLFSDEAVSSAICLWIQKCLSRREDPKATKKKGNKYYGIFLDEFSELFQIGKLAKEFIEVNLKSNSKRKQIDIASAVIRELIFEGKLDEKELKRVDVCDYIVPKSKINEILKDLELPQIFCTADPNEVVKVHNSAVFRCPLSAFASIKEGILRL